MAHIIRAHQAADSRLDGQALHQRCGEGAWLIGGYTPGDASLRQCSEQRGNAGVGLGGAAEDLAIQGQQALSLGFELWLCFLCTQGEGDQRPRPIGDTGGDERGFQWRQPVFSAQRLHHHHEFAGRVDQGAVQIEQHRTQPFQWWWPHREAGLLARSM